MQYSTKPFHHTHSAGFSMTELAVVLVIIGTLVGISLSVGNTQLQIADIKSTERNLEVAEKALELFQRQHGRYPCPALRTEVAGNADYGVERDHLNNCNGAVQDGNGYIGFLPFNSLNLPEKIAYDAWGNRITYIVDVVHTQSSEFQNGSLQIQDASGNPATVSSELGGAIFTLVSHGEDGKGGFNNQGVVLVACGNTTLDSTNCSDSSTIIAARTNDSGDAVTSANYYNDLVRWHAQSQIEPYELDDDGVIDLMTSRHVFYSMENSVCFINSDNRLQCSGKWHLPTGSVQTDEFETLASIDNWVMLSTGDNGSGCGIVTTAAGQDHGLAYCWGNNTYGQLGLGHNTHPQREPQPILLGNYWSYISVDQRHGCAIRLGRLYCWGQNFDDHGSLGLGKPSGIYYKPQLVQTGITNWESLTVSSKNTCGIAEGRIYCWGQGSQGKIGNGSTADQHVPTQINHPETDWEIVHGTSGHFCGIRQNGELWCWGSNSNGKLGLGGGGDRLIPERVGTDSDWTYVWAGSHATCGVRDNGRGYCWGLNNNMQLGTTNTGSSYNSPQEVEADDDGAQVTDWAYIATRGEKYTCGVRQNGELWCWGLNDSGAFGTGSIPGTISAPARTDGVEVLVQQ